MVSEAVIDVVEVEEDSSEEEVLDVVVEGDSSRYGRRGTRTGNSQPGCGHRGHRDSDTSRVVLLHFSDGIGIQGCIPVADAEPRRGYLRVRPPKLLTSCQKR